MQTFHFRRYTFRKDCAASLCPAYIRSMKRDEKKYLARLMYLQGANLKEITDKTGMAYRTLKKYIDQEKWEALRAGMNVTRTELVNKVLVAISKLLDNAIDTGDEDAFDGLADKLAKFAKTIESLDRKATVVDYIETFTTFIKWLQARSNSDNEADIGFIKKVNRFQDLFIKERLNG